jgi:asparagine synthetase B (glutamine-hydrolysing)
VIPNTSEDKTVVSHHYYSLCVRVCDKNDGECHSSVNRNVLKAIRQTLRSSVILQDSVCIYLSTGLNSMPTSNTRYSL